MKEPIKVIDLFAGPGGLGEGFAAHKDFFKIAISIEKEKSAHRTLTLRAFFRQFKEKPPEEYYQFLRGELGKTPEEILYKIPKYKEQIEAAKKEARRLTLGIDNNEIYNLIREVISPKEECILIGGPPCQAYSLAGQARNLNNKNYIAEQDNRNFLYLEYLKIIALFQPKVFIMENVKGMLSAKINGEPIFKKIIEDLNNPSKSANTAPDNGRTSHTYKIYSLVLPTSNDSEVNKRRNPKEYIIQCENFGIPQKRHRVILLGLRQDLANKVMQPNLLKKSLKTITAEDVLKDLPKLRSGLSKTANTPENWKATINNFNKSTLNELRANGLNQVANEIEKNIEKIKPFENQQGKNIGLKTTQKINIENSKKLEAWYHDKRLNNHVVNHETRGHIELDLHRYLFSSSWAQVAARENWDVFFPKSRDYPESLKPKHKNFDSGKFSDRFRVQTAQYPATTITSHISKDGHYFIHYDPLQVRSLTVREAARIQTFPDNYFFVGNRTEQYIQVGNAVPPYLAYKIAKIIIELTK